LFLLRATRNAWCDDVNEKRAFLGCLELPSVARRLPATRHTT
jgi:hypothetical protein